MNYGLPYKGSKNRIVNKILQIMPNADTFVDLFAGGCSMSHAAMLSNKYKNIIINDINDIPKLFINAINGKYKDEKRWISREDFIKLKDYDPYVKVCWSFGNNNRDYLYSKVIEPYKKACHYVIVFDEWEDLKKLCPEIIDVAQNTLKNEKDIKQRRLLFGPTIIKWLKNYGNMDLINNNPLYKSVQWKRKNAELCSLENLERLKRIQSLQSLESLERIQSLQSLKAIELDGFLEKINIEVYQKDYREIEIPQNAIVYCDIPYKNTNPYNISFNHEEFYDWALKQPFKIYISEYSMPAQFKEVLAIEHNSIISATANNKVIEKVFINHE